MYDTLRYVVHSIPPKESANVDDISDYANERGITVVTGIRDYGDRRSGGICNKW